MLDHLPHASDECVGTWRLHGIRGLGYWKCDVCGVEHDSVGENDRAADREFARGVQLENAARMHRIRDIPAPPPPMIEMEDDDVIH